MPITMPIKTSPFAPQTISTLARTSACKAAAPA